MMPMRAGGLCILLLVHLVPCTSSSAGSGWAPGISKFSSRSWFPNSPPLWYKKKRHVLSKPGDFKLPRLCGGDQEDSGEVSGEKDGERYSRQFYTLGARAHGLVRAATIYLDGPRTSGLLYECGKNLALSGVGHIVVLSSDDDGEEDLYHNAPLDDLGRAYERAARSELGYEANEESASMNILVEYLQRLNPSIDVSKMPRSDLEASKDLKGGVLLCVDRPQSSQIHLNGVCREQNIPFVAVETAGVYGRTFCDFGPSFEVFDADGETPLFVPLDHVELTEDGILVHSVEGEKHDVSKGDEIVFQISSGDSLPQSCTVMKVQSPERIVVGFSPSERVSTMEFVNQVNAEAVSFSREKIPQEFSFVPLDSALDNCKEDDSLFAPCDFDKSLDEVRKYAILCCFEAKQRFLEKNGQLPSKEDTAEFESIARSCVAAKECIVGTEKWQNILASFTACCPAKLTPIQAMFGAIGAQEALKAATGLYNPIQQFLLYDCDELLAAPTCVTEEKGDTLTGAPGQAYIFGQSLNEKMAARRLFIVGAGAIGCELLKNLAAMGAGTGTGRIVVTDMDTIERSNLSRQLLFRDVDIGKFKSKAAQDAVLGFNPAINMEVHTSKVGDEDHGPFDDIFWSEGIDIILNALDNVEARLFMDGQSVAYRKALIDAGTLGSKGNVQVVVPGQSESYGSSVDPPEPAIPVCTLKNFPYAITHTIEWGRDLFDGFFQRRPTQANENAAQFSTSSSLDFSEHLVEKLGADAALETSAELAEDLGVDHSKDRSDAYRESSIAWAVESARKLFHENIDEILCQHPEDSVDEDGEPFWSGTRRLPKKLSFSTSGELDSHQAMVNDNLIEFVRAAARLRIETFLPTMEENEASLVSAEEAAAALSKSDWESASVQETKETDEDAISKVNTIISGIARQGATSQLNAVEFEKDDVANGHVAFVTAASNLRALCYGIAPVDAMETRRVAGKVVPAMITTTGFVSALSCIELLKLLQEAPLRLHRNGFINLALPFFAFTAPLPAEEVPGLQGESYTLWDRIVVQEGKKSAASGGMTLRRFLRRVRKKASPDPDSIDISTLAYGPYMIYANFLHEDDENMLDRPLWELLKEAVVSGDDFDDEFSRDGSGDRTTTAAEIEGLDRRAFIDLTAVVEEQESGDEVELPPVRFVKWRQ